VQTSYLIGEIVMIPLAGWLSRVMSTHWLFTASAAGFTLTSVLCGSAWNIESMIVFRALQGFLGGAMIPTVFTTAFLLFQGRQRASAAALIGIIATLAPTLGPTLGGWVTDRWSWEWLFYINILPGGLIVALVPLWVRFDRAQWNELRNADYLGIALIALSLGSLEYVLEEGPRYNWFENAFMQKMVFLAGVSGLLLIWRSLVATRPVVNLRVLRSRNFTFGCAASFVLGMGMFGSVYLVPVFLGTVRQLSSWQIGVAICTTGFFQILSVPVAATLAKKFDLRWVLAFGYALFAIGVWMLTPITHDWGWRELLLPQAVRGFALMFCIVPANAFALGSLTPEELRSASGLYNLMRNLGGAIGIALFGTVLNNRTNLHYLYLMEHLNVSSVSIRLFTILGERMGDPQLARLREMKQLARLVYREALVLSFADAFLLLSACFLVVVLVVPFSHSCYMDHSDRGLQQEH
jgi:MFS transporter, DHA2 family, multidrug resistance protein